MTKIITNFIITALLGLTFIFSSCSDDSNPAAPNPPVTTQLIFLDTAYAEGGRALVSLYVEDSLHVGYNPVYIVLHDSLTGQLITEAHVEFDIVNHSHNVPVENPSSATSTDGKFIGAFILNASQANDEVLHYHYHVLVHNHQAPGKPEGTAAFSDFVVKDNPDKFKSIVMPDSSKLYLSYITPKSPSTGLNDFEFLINRNEPELFPPDGSYTVTAVPEFLSDLHTTSGNVNPVGSTDGHYKGKINLDRSGLWRIKLNVSKNGVSYDTSFELSY